MGLNLHIHNDYDLATKTLSVLGVEPFFWDEEESHANYTKPTDFTTICQMIETAPDYKSGRDYIKSVLLTLGVDEETAFNNVATEDRPILCKHKLGTVNQRISTVGYDNHIDLMVMYRIKTMESRQKRALYADVLVQNELPNDKMAIMNASGSAFSLYKDFGVDGIDHGDSVPSIDDYLNSKNGYESTGLSVQTYTPTSMTLADFVEKLTKLTIQGIY